MFASFFIIGLVGSALAPPPSPNTDSAGVQIPTAGLEALKSRPIRVIQGNVPTVHNECPTLSDTRVVNLGCSEAAALIEKLKEAQAKLGKGDQSYFELLSGSLASNQMTKTSPRDVFLKTQFEKASVIERVRTDNRLWQPFKLSYVGASHSYGPSGLVQFYWDIEVVLGSSGRIERVQMIYKPPPPF